MQIEEPNYDVRNLLNKEPRRKKERKILPTLLITSSKRKKKKEKSELAKWGADISRNKLKNDYAIREYIHDKYRRDPSTGALNILKLIGKTKVYNEKLIFSDNFANNPLYFYVNYYKYPIDFVSNDELFLVFVYKTIYQKLMNDPKTEAADKAMLSFMEDSIMSKCYITSNSFVLNVGTISQGIYQDFDENFAVLNCSRKPEYEEVQEFVNGYQSTGTFKFKNITFVVYNVKNPTKEFCKGAYVIMPQEETEEKTKAKLDAGLTKFSIYKKEGTKISEGVKTLDIKSSRVKFLDMRLIPEKFCPNFTKLVNSINCNVIYKMKFDLNVLFDKLDKYFEAHSAFGFYRNSCYWDTMETWFDFLSIYALTSPKLNNENKKLLLTFVDDYINNKQALMNWKALQLYFQKLLKEFFTSFEKGINYDKLKSLYERFSNYNTDLNQLIADKDEHARVVHFVNEIAMFANAIQKQFNNDLYNLADRIVIIFKDFIENKVIDDAVRNFRYLAQAIYKLSLSYSNDYTFPIVISQANFLGNLGAGGIEADPLKTVLSDAVFKEEKKIISAEEKVAMWGNINEHLGEYREQVIENNVKSVSGMKGWRLNADTQRALTLSVLQKFIADPAALNGLDKSIARAVITGEGVNSITIEPKFVEEAFNNYNVAVMKKGAVEALYNEWEKLKYWGLAHGDLPKLAEGVEIKVEAPTISESGDKMISMPPVDVSGGVKIPGVGFPIGAMPKSAVPTGGTSVVPMVPPAAPPKRKEFHGVFKSPEIVPMKIEESKIKPTTIKVTDKGDFKLEVPVAKKSETKVVKLEVAKPEVKAIKPEKTTIKVDEKGGFKLEGEAIKSETKPEKKVLIKHSKKGGFDVEVTTKKPETSGYKSMKDILRKDKGGISVADELKRIEEKQKEDAKIYEKINKKIRDFDEESSSSSFISKDYDFDFKNRHSALSIMGSGDITPVTKYGNVKILDKINPILTVYKELLKLMGKFVPQISNYLKTVKGTPTEQFMQLAANCPISDAFIDTLAKNNNKIPKLNDYLAYWSRGQKRETKWFDNYDSIEPKHWNITAPVVRAMMNEEYKYWPIYSEPKSASEGFLTYEKEALDKEGKEPKGIDLMNEDVEGFIYK